MLARNLYDRIGARFVSLRVSSWLLPREPARLVRLMFLLHTNVLSALMQREPVPEVAAWISAQSTELLFTTTICQPEILTGIAIMPEGHRRARLRAAAQAMFQEDFASRVLPFDMAAAVAYADMLEARWRSGRSGATFDLMIAAIAGTQGASLVTRNVADFEGCPVAIINPWHAPA